MSTTHAPPVHVHRPHVNLWIVAVVGLAAALIALGSWVLIDRYTGGGGATHDATTLIDDFNAAAGAHDANALQSLLASDVVIWSNGSTFVGSKNMVKEIMSTPGLSVKRLAPVSVEGEFATTFVQFAVPAAGINGPMVDVFQLKDGKIFRMWAFALGVTPPLDNAVMP